MAFLIVVIAFDLINIPFIEAIRIVPFLGFSNLDGFLAIAQGGIGLRDNNLGDILVYDRASFSLFLPSLTHLFLFPFSFLGSF